MEHIIKHETNKEYGGNQKTCYKKAIEMNTNIIVVLHPDYQFTPKLTLSMCYLIANKVYKVVLGSRFLQREVIKGGMPHYKYEANMTLTLSKKH